MSHGQSAASIECVARRFLHDFTSDTSRPQLRDADQAAWFASSLRKQRNNKEKNNNNNHNKQYQDPFVSTFDEQDPAAMLLPSSSSSQSNNSRSSSRGGLTTSSYAVRAQEQKQKSRSNSSSNNNKNNSSSSANAGAGGLIPVEKTSSSSTINLKKRNSSMSPLLPHQDLNLIQQQQNSNQQQQNRNQLLAASTNPESKKRTVQLAAMAQHGCNSKMNPIVNKKCTGQPRWDPNSRIVSKADPLYALLHRRLEEEGFMSDSDSDFDAAYERYQRRLSKKSAQQKDEELVRRDKELQWYLEVYRPKQKREAFLEVENDERLDISEQEMTARMKIKQKFWDMMRVISLREKRRELQEEAELRAIQQQQEIEDRHLRSWLAQGQHVIQEEEATRRKEIRHEAEAILLNYFSAAEHEREHMCRVRLLLLNRLRTDLSHIMSSENNRRSNILALEATAKKQMQQSFLTERAEMFGKQRNETQSAAIRLRREIAKQEVEERQELFKSFSEKKQILDEINNLFVYEEQQRYHFLLKEQQEEFQQVFVFEFQQGIERIATAQIMEALGEVEEEANMAKLQVIQESQITFDKLWNEAATAQQHMVQKSITQLFQQESADRSSIIREFHQFVVERARFESQSIDLLSLEQQDRHMIAQIEGSEITHVIFHYLLASLQIREAKERAAIERQEHQAASRLVVEAAILRDTLVSSRRHELGRLRGSLERDEHDARTRFVSEKLEFISKMINDFRSTISQIQKKQDAKLLQQALRLQTNFVGIGLAERPISCYLQQQQEEESSSSKNNNKTNNKNKNNNNNDDDEDKMLLQVESLVRDGPGMQAGLKLGDLVLSIGGIPVTTTLEMRSALKRSGFVSKETELVVRRFIPKKKQQKQKQNNNNENNESESENEEEVMETIEMNTPAIIPTQRPEGTFVVKTEKLQLLVSTTDERFKAFPFYFNSKKTARISLPLVS